MCVCVCVTHSHKSRDKSVIKKNELHMCCCRPISSVHFDEKNEHSATYTMKDIVVLVHGTESHFEKGKGRKRHVKF